MMVFFRLSPLSLPSLPLLVPRFHPRPPATFTTIFFNCRSLQAHHHLITSDSNIMCADVLFLCETRINEASRLPPLLLQAFPYYCLTGAATPGTALLLRHPPLILRWIETPFLSGSVAIVPFGDATALIVGVYARPSTSTPTTTAAQISQLACEVLQDFREIEPTFIIVGGDVNTETTLPLPTMTRLMLPVTTDYRTSIDHLYVSASPGPLLLGHGTLESIFSDHKPLWLRTSLPPPVVSL